MNVLKQMKYGVHKALLAIYGAGEQDRPADPIEQLEREHDNDEL